MPLDDAALLAMLAPDYRACIERMRTAGDPALASLSPDEARDYMRSGQTADISAFPVTSERHFANGVPIFILRPAGASGPLPVILYLHGGGWVLGDADTHARMIREIVVRTQGALVFVDYARAPEAPFPRPLEDCYQALAWIAEHGRALSLDPTRIAVAGDSAGGNLAAALGLLSARRDGPRLCFQALLYPVTGADFTTSSYRDFALGLNLDVPAMQWFWNHYLPDPAFRVDPLASPLRAPTDELSKLPPALVITAECDVLRDEGESFARNLARSGVPVSSVRYGGVLHGFMVDDELAQTPQARSAMALLAAHLREALHIAS
ncbi:MAG TPA: alpha/beta hydrolase [Acidobacteriaceae bacterium]|nr:alpha/beta hydrolase [Acidobacteriaceae bacterium]